MTEPRQWSAYAHQYDDLPDGREFLHVDTHPRTVAAYGPDPVVPVVLVEDPDGMYWGWIWADRTGLFVPRYTGEVIMIQPTWGIFSMQFPYGPEAEADRGHGEIVRLSIFQSDASAA